MVTSVSKLGLSPGGIHSLPEARVSGLIEFQSGRKYVLILGWFEVTLFAIFLELSSLLLGVYLGKLSLCGGEMAVM